MSGSVSLDYIASQRPCYVFNVFLKALGKDKPDGQLTSLRQVIDITGLEGAVWTLSIPKFAPERRQLQSYLIQECLPLWDGERGKSEVLTDCSNALLADPFDPQHLDVCAQEIKAASMASGSLACRSVARIAYKSDIVLISKSAEWVSRRYQLPNLSEAGQVNFLREHCCNLE